MPATSLAEYMNEKNRSHEAALEKQGRRYEDELREQAQKAYEGNQKIRAACLEELAQKAPDNRFYRLSWLQSILTVFYNADWDQNGQLSIHEFLRAFGDGSEEKTKQMQENFKEVDVSGDEKLSFAEFFILTFLRSEREHDYPAAHKY